jgi:hypothetical protein
MLAAGAGRTFKPVIDGMIASLCGWLLLFALALAALHISPAWMSSVSMVVASLLLALAGLSRYLADPTLPSGPAPQADESSLPLHLLQSPES